MSTQKNTPTTREILEAANDAARYALARSKKIETAADPSGALVETVERAFFSIVAMLSPKSSPVSIKAHAINASIRLRSALNLLEFMPVGSQDQSATKRAVERLLILLSPMIFDEIPIESIPLKSPKSRRQRPVARERYQPRPAADVTVVYATGTDE